MSNLLVLPVNFQLDSGRRLELLRAKRRRCRRLQTDLIANLEKVERSLIEVELELADLGEGFDGGRAKRASRRA